MKVSLLIVLLCFLALFGCESKKNSKDICTKLCRPYWSCYGIEQIQGRSGNACAEPAECNCQSWSLNERS